MGFGDIQNRVVAELEHGRTKTQIFERLVAESPAKSATIAYCIAAVPDQELRRKYLTHNAILCVLLVVYAALNLYNGLPVQPDEPTLFIAITTLIPLVFAYFVFRFHGGVYRLTGIWFSIDLLENLLLVGAPDGLAVLELVALFAIIVLSFLIARRVFPQLGILGPKKDAMGMYRL